MKEKMWEHTGTCWEHVGNKLDDNWLDNLLKHVGKHAGNMSLPTCLYILVNCGWVEREYWSKTMGFNQQNYMGFPVSMFPSNPGKWGIYVPWVYEFQIVTLVFSKFTAFHERLLVVNWCLYCEANWWFRPPEKIILVRLDHHPNYWGK